MGTFIYHGSSIFWRNVKDYASLHGNEVVCWKFLVILYRILQDGQANAVRDSLEQLEFIGQFDFFLLHCHFSFNSEVKMFFFSDQVSKYHRNSRSELASYGRLSGALGRLIMTKLFFLKKYPEIPGNLILKENTLTRLLLYLFWFLISRELISKKHDKVIFYRVLQDEVDHKKLDKLKLLMLI